ncbi:MAG: hypothetical protein LC751_10455 [Actinobacteria bacterium]|nr:hypothetical protein [Actinomycetota bacterium]
MMDLVDVEGRKTAKVLEEHKLYITEAMNAFFDKKLLERVGFANREDLVKVPPPSTQSPPPEQEIIEEQPPEKQPNAGDSEIVTTVAERGVYDYVRYRLPFLIARDEELFRKLDEIYFRDFKGTFAVCYKQDRKGRLFNFREGADPKYRFEFPESGATISTDNLPDIDDELLDIFMKRVEELG